MSPATRQSSTAADRSAAHVGRPRDPSRADAIREAVLELLVEQGYERVTIEAVAARAGAGKATVYRRWGSKAELVLDAVADLHGALQPPDTGSLAGDFAQLCVGLTDKSESQTVAVMQGLASAIPHDRALAAAFAKHFVAPRRAVLAEVFARAESRGEMPAGKDIDLLTAVIPALMLYRAGTGRSPDPTFVRRIATEVLLPAASSPTVRLDPRGGRS
jgi:AcrR family transcriptional regulator